jgi:hypothetical protein
MFRKIFYVISKFLRKKSNGDMNSHNGIVMQGCIVNQFSVTKEHLNKDLGDNDGIT